MRTDRRDSELAAWLGAESAGGLDEADARFAVLFRRHVPRLRPAAGVADRVIAALDRLGARAPAATVPWWGRAAAVVLLAVGGLAAATLWPVGVFDIASAVCTAALRLTGFAAVGVAWCLQEGVRAWAALRPVGGALALAAASAPMVALIAANLTLALGAGIGLTRLLAQEE